jgi:5-methylcytosine-specific restriction protein A
VHSAAGRVAEEADALAAAVESAGDDELVALLPAAEAVARRLDRLVVDTVAMLQRRGVFAERGYRSTAGALADLAGWDRSEAHRRIAAAEQVCPRVGLDGGVVPPRLPATAERSADGGIGLRHVEVVTKLLTGETARRLPPEVWADAEGILAEHAVLHTPAELHRFGNQLITALDQDGPEPRDDPPPVNELFLAPSRDGGGTLTGRFGDAALWGAITTLIEAKTAPRSTEDPRSTAQRRADALGEVCGYVLAHGDLPQTGGHRPTLTVTVTLDDLERRARGAVLDLGGTLTPAALRRLCCDAAVVPVVMGGAGQPLDVGRATRTIPDGLRRAVAARDRGCAFPGCDRPPSWAEVHHVVEWQHGGPTEIDNLVMLCGRHHRVLHESGWIVRIRDGLPEFVPPRWIDPDQHVRRKPPVADVRRPGTRPPDTRPGRSSGAGPGRGRPGTPRVADGAGTAAVDEG